MNDMAPRPTNGLSLCAGGGGLDMGLMLAEPGFHTRCFVEWEEYPRQALIAGQRAGYFAPAPIYGDVTRFDGTRFRGAFDTILAGYPCQPFSSAGKRKGENDERHLWPDIARIIREVRPIWVFLENVKGHVSLGAETVLRDLREMGFTASVGLFTANETGAPHERTRWFCVAYSEDNARWLYARSRGEGGGTSDAERGGRELSHDQSQRSQKGRLPIGTQKKVTGTSSKGGKLDNAERIGRSAGRHRDHREYVGQQSDAEGCKLADACFRRSREPGKGQDQQPRGAETICTEHHLVHTTGERCGERFTGPEVRKRLTDNFKSGCKLPHPGQPGPQGGECSCTPGERNWQETSGPAAQLHRPLLHPPGPGEYDLWRDVIGLAPGTMPALSLSDVGRVADHYQTLVSAGRLDEAAAESDLHRMVDGLATRTRALKLLGNGVHPLCAAYAWRSLSHAHGLMPMDLAAANTTNETSADAAAVI